MAIQSADRTCIGALALTLDALSLGDEDRAAIELARTLASALDAAVSAGDNALVDKLAPRFLASLEALGATPRSRAGLRAARVESPEAGALSLATLRAAQ